MTDKRKIHIDEDDEIVTMTYEDGTTEDFFCIAELDYGDKMYAYLQPVEEKEDFTDDDVLIYEIAEQDGEEIFLPVEDDNLLDQLVEELNNAIDESDDEEEEDEEDEDK